MSAWIKRVVVLVLVVGFFANLVLGLRSDELAEAEERLARCTQVPAVVAEALAAWLDDPDAGTLHHAWAVPAADDGDHAGRWFLSAQLRRPGMPRTAPGRILTWTTTDPTAPLADYLAVDEHARERTSWPDDPGGPVVVTDEASIASRACVHETRPGKKGLFH